MFEGFETRSIAVNDVTINVVVKGNGPPLLLLHGYPQTHVMWHKIAPALAEHYTVVATDLRGYGDSSKPVGDDQHLTYSKRSMAADQVAVMTTLGFARFCVAGHDRGGRVTEDAWKTLERSARDRWRTACRSRATRTRPEGRRRS